MAPRQKARQILMDGARIAVESSNSTTRSSGLDDLIHIFKEQTKASNFSTLDDKSYHITFEALFRCALAEKQAYYSHKSTAASRLTKCAEALRLGVELGAGKVKRKTVLAVIDHITQTLPHSEDDLVPPLIQDYIKALAALLSHAANVELLAAGDGEGWFTCVDFTVDVLTLYLAANDRDSILSRASPAPGSGHSTPLTFSTPRPGTASQRTSRLSRSQLPDLLQCLLYLSSTPNAPLLQRSKEMSSVVVQVLQLRPLGIGPLHQLAFALVNKLFVASQTDDSDHANSLALDCLPLISQWWQTKAASAHDALLNGVRVEMLKLLFNIHLQLEFLIKQGDKPSLLGSIETLAELLWSEYSRREERAQLQQDDLTYSAPHSSTTFQVQSFSLRLFNIDGEKTWAVVHILALLERLLWKASEQFQTTLADDEQPRKKRRTASGFSRLRQKLRSVDHSIQYTALQITPFFVSGLKVNIDEMSELLSFLVSQITSKNSKVATWAMIACASLTPQVSAADNTLSAIWKQIWQITVRSVTMTTNCRASSVLLHSIITRNLVPYRDISDDINSMITTADVNGPAVVVDSSLILMTTLLHLRNFQLPSASYTTCNCVVRWIFFRWDPTDAAYISSYSNHVKPVDIINLMKAAYGDAKLILSRPSQTISGQIGETLCLLQSRESLIRYLLLLDSGASDSSSAPSQQPSLAPVTQLGDTTNSHGTKKLVAELFYSKLEDIRALCEAWDKQKDKSIQITPEKLQSIISSLIVGVFILPEIIEVNSRPSQEVQNSLFSILQTTLAGVSNSYESHVLYDCLLTSVRSYMPALSSAELGKLGKEWSYLHRFFFELSGAFRKRNDSQSSGNGDDFMDLDDDFESKEHRSNASSKSPEVSRHEATIALQAVTFHSDTIQRLRLLDVLYGDHGQIGLVPASFLNDFLELSNEELLTCRCLARELFDSDLIINPDDADRVIGRMGDLIGSAAFSSCEVALNICLDVMEGLMPIWSDSDGEISSRVGDLYHYFLNAGLKNNMLSSSIQMSLARLLLRLIQLNEKYTETIKMEPPSSSLLSILGNAAIPVKYYVGSRLPTLFGRYTLKSHDEVLVDVLEVLPSKTDFLEGIALRLFILAELAREWPTLLRRGIYHIFEIPGEIPSSKRHAARCLDSISASLNLENTQQLFDLFAPQLLYTWLEIKSIDDIPFMIFGFSTLKELLQRAQSEVVALMVMRGQDDEATRLAAALGDSPAQLIQRNFSRIIAYSMAHDISMPKAEQQRSGESRLRRILGREAFLEAIYINFADIIGLFFSLIDQENPVEESWARDKSFAYAAEAMAEIKKCGHSEVGLSPNQQPMFRAKYLTREISLLCSRTEYEISALWTPALVVSVARKLLNGVHSALGPLHTCSVLRKVRVLICLAGQHAWESYPLEMLLQSIRPLIVDTECADDALGMSQYLLEKGSEPLSQSPSFLAGYALSALASLRVFLETSQSSTTQESQFKATMNKAQKFHSWFTKYLEDYESPFLQDSEHRAAFEAITSCAAHVRSSGNAERGTHESKLLLEILQDGVHGAQLLNEPSRKLALEMLCSHFTIPTSYSVDVISTDEEALTWAPVVWKSCQAQGLSNEYLAWAGRVVGRGFAASGLVDQDLLRESELSRYFNASVDASGSEHGLLSLLQSLTSDSDCYKAGLAESALRTIVSEAAAQGDNNLLIACQKVLSDQLLATSDWTPYRTPPSDNMPIRLVREDFVLSNKAFQDAKWAQGVAVYLAQSYPENIILNALPPILTNVKGFSKQAFPYIIHLVLLFEQGKQQSIKRSLSGALKNWLKLESPAAKENMSLFVNALLYLRTQQLPGENSIADRGQWLDLDLLSVASAAAKCGMFKTALLFVEMTSTEGSRASRRSSAVRAQDSTDILMNIFENIDDPDAYYGLSHTSSLSNVLARLEYEKNGSMSLAFRGAQYDSHIRRRDPAANIDGRSLVRTLGNLGLSGLSHSLLQTEQSLDGSSTTVESTFNTARRLEIWNLPAPTSTDNPSVTLYRAYQTWQQATELGPARSTTHNSFSETMRSVAKKDLTPVRLRHHLSTLAVLAELNDVVEIAEPTELDRVLTAFTDRSGWMKSGRYEDVSQILSCRETTLSVLAQTSQRRGMAQINSPEATLAQIKSMLLSSSIYRHHRATQESLNIATSLTDLVAPSADLGLHLDSVAKFEAADALWDHGEMTSSIHMLQSIDEDPNLKKQTIPISRPDLLAKTGYQISVAKLEKPETIQREYLQPALKELKGKTDSREAGKVYHQFAMFCDEQLQNPDGLEDLARLQHLRKGKSDEVSQLKGLISSTRDSQMKSRYNSHLTKARQWLDLDEQELRRVEQSRTEFIRLSLENYLLSLVSCDDHNNDALRFTALWLERSTEEFTNQAVMKHIDKVATRKFATLMNQLTSRLIDQKSTFQSLLSELIYRICVDHPYHGMYQIWSGVKSRTNTKDDVAILRQKATDRVGKRLAQTESVSTIWAAIDKTSKAYHMLAVERDPSRYKAGQKVPVKDSTGGSGLATALAKWKIPPPTMQIELSASRDYSHIPYISKIEPNMSIASGVSAPKIITVVGTNGERFKQLVKGGNDDLRQDAIMEQVFAAVSSVLKDHRSTQQRSLGIRTYKVLPLTAASGLIEFVSNTIPLHEYLMPAHERYHPKDLKGSQCRKEISQVQNKSADARVATYKKITDRFQPVMRYFFMEHFVDPDEWFAKRTAYTRTTAAISILGHILGLGDRHGHNILLDSKTGEVVHIDLGVAFEMGRVLPVPELVPFRLTRDIVDGMGITKTEGVFRRCCEFTLDALREETYSIMTILDVLRYDPLYSWSISPVRMAKLQDTRRDEEVDGADADIDSKKKKAAGTVGVVNEPSEADRALEVVRKKLSKTLSVTATVNDLINQATDERNLAFLYSGWAAYA
ncbi:Serine/threonine-protein kinase tel-1 [Daldinia decipiens]|uniref:Serine/threonine-protein kinase tel-1 n=1 Tax=Daldinia decipiens TaxID=326647 RepID=UPI0020C238CB|nr:Serine/threonine-protein kinase tel-1 [Daldinia decipiens]KAI1655111.1 Serine/threonine-protein kinase tel-1 [Daldinia decipiens]